MLKIYKKKENRSNYFSKLLKIKQPSWKIEKTIRINSII